METQQEESSFSDGKALDMIRRTDARVEEIAGKLRKKYDWGGTGYHVASFLARQAGMQEALNEAFPDQMAAVGEVARYLVIEPFLRDSLMLSKEAWGGRHSEFTAKYPELFKIIKRAERIGLERVWKGDDSVFKNLSEIQELIK